MDNMVRLTRQEPILVDQFIRNTKFSITYFSIAYANFCAYAEVSKSIAYANFRTTNEMSSIVTFKLGETWCVACFWPQWNSNLYHCDDKIACRKLHHKEIPAHFSTFLDLSLWLSTKVHFMKEGRSTPFFDRTNSRGNQSFLYTLEMTRATMSHHVVKIF